MIVRQLVLEQFSVQTRLLFAVSTNLAMHTQSNYTVKTRKYFLFFPILDKV